MNIEREIEIVKAFFVPTKRERYIEFLNSSKGRPQLLENLYHFGDFDPNCVIELSGASNSAEGLLAELQRRGADHECYVISAAKEIDGVTEPLADVIHKVFACPVFEGTIVYCAKDTLAYYEGEAPKNRFILHKRSVAKEKSSRH